MTSWWPHTRSAAGKQATGSSAAWDFHRSLPDYAPTNLVELPELAAQWNVGRVVAKDESTRLGLPAFKALGASWAIHRAIADRPGPLTIVTATDGNHGRAVARFARTLGHSSLIFIPDGVHPSAVQAIRDEGGQVLEVGGSYDSAVAAAAKAAEAPGCLLVQDTAWPGYEEIPAWIVEGYSTLFAEVDEQLALLGGHGVDLALIQSCVAHCKQFSQPGRMTQVGTSPGDRASALTSARAWSARPPCVPSLVPRTRSSCKRPAAGVERADPRHRSGTGCAQRRMASRRPRDRPFAPREAVR